MAVLDVHARSCIRIRLTETQWKHIRSRHPELVNQEALLLETLEDPDRILFSDSQENYHYVRRFPNTALGAKSVVIVARHLESEGFVITAWLVSKIREAGKGVTYERKG